MTEIHFPDAESGGIVDQVQNPSRKFYLIVSKITLLICYGVIQALDSVYINYAQ